MLAFLALAFPNNFVSCSYLRFQSKTAINVITGATRLVCKSVIMLPVVAVFFRFLAKESLYCGPHFVL